MADGDDDTLFGFAVALAIAGASGAKFTAGTWTSVGKVGKEIKAAIGQDNIEIDAATVTIRILSAGRGKNAQTVAVVDVTGDEPTQFRAVYVAVNGKYVGRAVRTAD